MPANSNKIIKGFAWTATERFSIQFVQFVIGIIIARIISPEEYGTLGILMVFVNVIQIFIDSGLGSAIIYRNNLDEKDLQTTFSFNFFVSLGIFLIIFFLAPFIESFFELNNLALYLRVILLVLFSNSMIVVPTAILKVKLDFKSLAISNITSTIVSGGIGIWFAYCNFGIWALIYQVIIRSVIQFILIYIQCRWIPKFKFYKNSFLQLYHYGVNVFGASCVTKIVDEATVFFVGKVFTPHNLGIFNRANQFASLPSTSIGTIVSSVLFPSFSSIKDDREKFDKMYTKCIEYQAAISIPIFFLLAMVADPLIRLLLTDKWIEVVPMMQIACVGRIFIPINSITVQAINALGRSDMFLYQQIIRMTIKMLLLIISFNFGVIFVVIAESLSCFLDMFIINYYAQKINLLSALKQLNLVKMYLLSAVVSSIIGYIFIAFFNVLLIKIVISLFVATSIYLLLIRLYNKELLLDICNKIFKRKLC